MRHPQFMVGHPGASSRVLFVRRHESQEGSDWPGPGHVPTSVGGVEGSLQRDGGGFLTEEQGRDAEHTKHPSAT